MGGMDEMVEGYLDGFKDDRQDYPETHTNRSSCYRHGWLNGASDRSGAPRGHAYTLRDEADRLISQHDAAFASLTPDSEKEGGR